MAAASAGGPRVGPMSGPRGRDEGRVDYGTVVLERWLRDADPPTDLGRTLWRHVPLCQPVRSRRE